MNLYKITFLLYSLSLIGFIMVIFMWTLGMKENAAFLWYHYLLLIYVATNIGFLVLDKYITKNRIALAIVNLLYLITSMLYIGDFTFGMDWGIGVVIFLLLFYLSAIYLVINICKNIKVSNR